MKNEINLSLLSQSLSLHNEDKQFFPLSTHFILFNRGGYHSFLKNYLNEIHWPLKIQSAHNFKKTLKQKSKYI